GGAGGHRPWTPTELEPHVPAVTKHLAHVTRIGHDGGAPAPLAECFREIPGVVIAGPDEKDGFVQAVQGYTAANRPLSGQGEGRRADRLVHARVSPLLVSPDVNRVGALGPTSGIPRPPAACPEAPHEMPRTARIQQPELVH